MEKNVFTISINWEILFEKYKMSVLWKEKLAGFLFLMTKSTREVHILILQYILQEEKILQCHFYPISCGPTHPHSPVKRPDPATQVSVH